MIMKHPNNPLTLLLLLLSQSPSTWAFSPTTKTISTTKTKTTTTATQLHSLPTPIDTLTSGLASIARLPRGITVDPTKSVSLTGPAAYYLPTLKQLYDVENNKECRSVRERITELDLVVRNVIPACENSRSVIDSINNYGGGGIIVVPTLVADVGGKDIVFEGKTNIINFLNEKFSMEGRENNNGMNANYNNDFNNNNSYMTTTTDTNSNIGWEDSTTGTNDMNEIIMNILDVITSYLPGILRSGRGTKVISAASPSSSSSMVVPRPQTPLVLYSYEGNQFCRLVRETLSELDIVYELRSAGKNSPRRDELASFSGGSTQCPFLVDPNTGAQMAESRDIIRYLYDTYALWTPPNELWRGVSNAVTPLLAPVFRVIAPLQAGSSSSSSGENDYEYRSEIAEAKAGIYEEVASAPVVVYTYELSPFCTEATSLLDSLGIRYREVSLGKEWIPGLITDPAKRAALLEITGQSSLPHIFIGGTSIGGLYSGMPGLIPALERGELMEFVEEAKRSMY